MCAIASFGNKLPKITFPTSRNPRPSPVPTPARQSLLPDTKLNCRFVRRQKHISARVLTCPAWPQPKIKTRLETETIPFHTPNIPQSPRLHHGARTTRSRMNDSIIHTKFDYSCSGDTARPQSIPKTKVKSREKPK